MPFVRENLRPRNRTHAFLRFSRRRRRIRDRRVTFMSHNINGIQKKYYSVRAEIEKERAAVIALQETLRTYKAREDDPGTSSTSLKAFKRLKFPGYHTFESFHERGCDNAKRGIALIVRKDFTAYEVGNIKGNAIFARIYGGGTAQKSIMGSVYVPTERHTNIRRTMIDSLVNTLLNLKRRYPNEEFIIGGDFNMKLPELKNICERRLNGMFKVNVMSERRRKTHIRSTPPTDEAPDVAIDHIITSSNVNRRMASKTFVRYADFSDHYPILSHIKKIGRRARQENISRKWKVHNYKIRKLSQGEEANEIFANNPFAILGQEQNELEEGYATESDEGIDVSENDVQKINNNIENLVSISQNIMKDNSMLVQKCQRPAKETDHLPRNIRDACIKKCQLHQVYTTNPEDSSKKNAYKTQAKETKELIRKHEEAKFQKSIEDVLDLFANGCQRRAYKKLWESCYKKARNSSGAKEVLLIDGEILSSEEDLRQGWINHWKTLFEPREEYERREYPELPQLPPADNLNAPISKEEFIECLKEMKNNKASGTDHIPIEWFKLLFSHASEEDLQRIVNALNDIFVKGIIPEIWQRAIIVPIYKSGSASDTNNYRGISLITSGLKLISSVVARRLLTHFKRGLSKYQAGFRLGEECAAQCTALWETLLTFIGFCVQ
eukprot:Nk52_evm20s270 gene=Nk52_evmTU20s270